MLAVRKPMSTAPAPSVAAKPATSGLVSIMLAR